MLMKVASSCLHSRFLRQDWPTRILVDDRARFGGWAASRLWKAGYSSPRDRGDLGRQTGRENCITTVNSKEYGSEGKQGSTIQSGRRTVGFRPPASVLGSIYCLSGVGI